MICVSLLTGFSLYDRGRRRVRTLEKLEQLLEEMETAVRYTASPIEEILCRCAENPLYAPLCFLQSIGEAVKKGRYNDRSFCRCLEEKTAEMGLTTEDIQPLLLLGTRLGATDVEGQLSMLKLCRRQLDEVREREAQHCKKTGKMYISLGLCVGIGAAIFLA